MDFVVQGYARRTVCVNYSMYHLPNIVGGPGLIRAVPKALSGCVHDFYMVSTHVVTIPGIQNAHTSLCSYACGLDLLVSESTTSCVSHAEHLRSLVFPRLFTVVMH